MSRTMHILLLADDSYPCGAINDHIAAFGRHSRHRWYVANPTCRERRRWHVERLDLERFDAVVIHYSVCVAVEYNLPAPVRARIAAYAGPKLQFIQDEYRWVHRTSDRMAELGVDTLFTLVRQELAERAYGDPRLRGVRKISTLAGYVPDELPSLRPPPVAGRRRHLGYRGRPLPYWLGRLAQDKVRIADGVRERAAAHGLEVDVSAREEDRIYGAAWSEFITSSKAVLGTEAGSSIWDFDGGAQRAVDAYLAAHPSASFEEVAREVLGPFEGNLDYATSSPRLFEAAALRTPMVMFPGRYDGIVEPDRHYIPLAKDFSNFAEVAEKLRDDAFLQQLADRTYEELVASGRFSMARFVGEVDAAVEETARAKGAAARGRRSPPEETAAALARTISMLRALDGRALLACAQPLAHELSVLADPDTGSSAARCARGAVSVPRELATLPSHVAWTLFHDELHLAKDSLRHLADQGAGPASGRVRRVGYDWLNHLNRTLPEPAAAALRRAGAALKQLMNGAGARPTAGGAGPG